MNIRKLTTLAFLTGLSLILFLVELQLPDLTPVPGVKLGLANIITVYAVFRFKAQEIAMLVTARVLLSTLCSANPAALLYSASGAALCLVGMLAVRGFIPRHWIWAASMLGAMFHNCGQLIAAMLVMHTPAVLGYLPVLLFSGCIAGLFTGLCAQYIVQRLEQT